MRRFFLIFFSIAAISWAVFYAVSVSHDRVAAAVDGVVDLRGATSEDMYALSGVWEFYWGHLYAPDDFAAGSPMDGTLIPVPSAWNSNGYPQLGYATYRVTLIAPNDVPVMLYVPELLTAADVWCNGEKIFSAGRVATAPAASSPYAKSDIVPLMESETGRYEIVATISNFERVNGGIRHPFRVGLGNAAENPLPRALFGWFCRLCGVVGAFFIVGFLYLLLYSFQSGQGGDERSNLVYLVFAASCVLIGLRFLFENDGFVQFFLRSDLLNPQTGRVYWCLSVVHTILVLIFPVFAFDIRFSRTAIRAFAVLLILPLALRMILPPTLDRATSVLYLFAYVAIIAQSVRRLSVAQIRERPYLGLYLFSLLFFMSWGTVVNLLANSYFFAGFSLSNTFMLLAQFVMLTQDYSEARRKARELAEKNDFYHRMAHDLLTPLTVVSTSVQVAGMVPEEAPELLRQSQAEIMKMAGKINDALDASWDDGGKDE